MPIGVALIGAGIWAREIHAPTIDATDNLLLKAVFSRSLKSAQSVAERISRPVDIYTDEARPGYEGLLQRSDIDGVVIALPIADQLPFIKTALLAGKHVLSEKPIAENVQDAEELIRFYRSEITGPTWAVAENWRFLNSYNFAAEQIKGLGRIIGFQGRQHDFIELDWRWNQTEWRRHPTHQGGYLLDVGVHFTAGLRVLLGAQPGNEIARLCAFTHKITDYLSPVDTADVILMTESGVSGVFQISRGTPLKADEWTVACEKGWVTVQGSKVTISREGEVEVIDIPNEGRAVGVPPEIRAWGESLVRGKTRQEQEPETALADLELIELMLRSGENGGAPVSCTFQVPAQFTQGSGTAGSD